MTCVARDHGKSIVYCNKYQWAMQYKDFDVLLLGWTARYKDIALYVYAFFEKNGLIESDKRTSPFHFKIKNGGKFDCFLITSKETLGMHAEGDQDRFHDLTVAEWKEFKSMFQDFDAESEIEFTDDELTRYVASRKRSTRKLWIAIDDPIDITFSKEYHKEEMLEMRFNSTLYSINPDKWSFTGTRKFDEDFFNFIEMKFGKKLVKYIRGAIDEKGKLLCPERFTHPDQPTYEEDLRKGKKDLDEIRTHIGEYAWYSEYQQNPHPVTGDVWDHVELEKMQDTPVNRKYDLCFISIDRATTTKRTSDFTGCIVGFRHMETGIRLITHDFTDKTPLEELLIMINDFVVLLRQKYSTLRILLIVEKQGGGDDFIEMARNRREFLTERNGKLVRIQNKIPGIAAIIEIHNTGEKMGRIKDRLYLPLINKQIMFMFYLAKSELVKEILTYPHSGKLDAIDALATAEFEVAKHPLQGGLQDQEEILMILKQHESNKNHDVEGSTSSYIKNLLKSKGRDIF